MAIPMTGEFPLSGSLNTIQIEKHENVVFISLLRILPSSQVKSADLELLPNLTDFTMQRHVPISVKRFEILYYIICAILEPYYYYYYY